MLVALEGYSPPYLDSAGVLTDCYGNTKNVSRETVRTRQQCDTLLNDETRRIADFILKSTTTPLTVGTLAAFISFVYNVGDGAWRNSTALKMLNAGDIVGACKQMGRWVYVTVGGVKIKLYGLENRRKVEMKQCLESI